MRMISLQSPRLYSISAIRTNSTSACAGAEVMDGFLRDRAASLGIKLVNELCRSIDTA